MLNFNFNGYLEPFEAIEIAFESAESLLVWNEHRAHIWANFEVFIADLQAILASPFSVWLNGSFATQKENPNDLDCVIFEDFEVYEANISQLLQLKMKCKKMRIDSYFVAIHGIGHKRNNTYELDKKEWFSLFNATKRDIYTGKCYSKGFLELNFFNVWTL